MVNLIYPTEVSPTPTKLHIKFASTKYWLMVDSGCSTSLVTEIMVHEDRSKNSWWSRKINPRNLRSFMHTPIRNVGTLYSDIQCNGCNPQRVVGRNIIQGLGIQVNQQPSLRMKGKQVAIIQNLEGQNLKIEIAKKFPNLRKRQGDQKIVQLNQNSKQTSRLFIKGDGEYHTGGRRTQKITKERQRNQFGQMQQQKYYFTTCEKTVKQNKTIKLAMDSNVINKAIHKNKYQMQNTDCLMNNIAQSISEPSHKSKVFFPLSTYDPRRANYHLTKQPQNLAVSTS